MKKYFVISTITAMLFVAISIERAQAFTPFENTPSTSFTTGGNNNNQPSDGQIGSFHTTPFQPFAAPPPDNGGIIIDPGGGDDGGFVDGPIGSGLLFLLAIAGLHSVILFFRRRKVIVS